MSNLGAWLYLKIKAEPVLFSDAAKALALVALALGGLTVAQFVTVGGAVVALLSLITRSNVTPWEPPE